jgi:hypothetical protein
MNHRQLARGNEILALIKIEEDAIARWEDFIEFKGSINMKGKTGQYTQAPSTYIPADMIRILCLQKHKERLEELQEEYDLL